MGNKQTNTNNNNCKTLVITLGDYFEIIIKFPYVLYKLKASRRILKFRELVDLKTKDSPWRRPFPLPLCQDFSTLFRCTEPHASETVSACVYVKIHHIMTYV